MRICILSDTNGWHTRDLCRAAEAHHHEVSVCAWSHLAGGVGLGPLARSQQTVLDEADCVLIRTMPPGSLEQIVFRMDLLQALEARGVRIVNGPRAIEVAVDKYLALWRLQRAGLEVPRTIVCQRASDALRAFESLGGDVLLKPLFGSEGVGISRVSDPALARRAFTLLERCGSVLYVQQFIPHDGADLRLFVLGDDVLAAMRRQADGWLTNIARGGTAQALMPTEAHSILARHAARACLAQVAGVDLLRGRDGRTYVLEVNAVPGWKALASVTGVDVADHIIAFAQQPDDPRGDPWTSGRLGACST